jgi:hypothetical protein
MGKIDGSMAGVPAPQRSHLVVAGSNDAHPNVHFLGGGVGHRDDQIESHLLDVLDAVG